MLPKLVSKDSVESVESYLRDCHVLDLSYIDTDIRGMGADNAVDLGIFSKENMCKYKITCVPMMLMDGSDIFRDVCGDHKVGGSVAVSAPSILCDTIKSMKYDLAKYALSNWYRQKVSGIEANEKSEGVDFTGALYFEICDDKLAAKCNMLGIKSKFCVHCYMCLHRDTCKVFSYDLRCRLSMIEIPGLSDFIKNNPDYVAVIK